MCDSVAGLSGCESHSAEYFTGIGGSNGQEMSQFVISVLIAVTSGQRRGFETVHDTANWVALRG